MCIPKKKGLLYSSFILLVIFLIALKADSEWCYLALMLILLVNTDFYNENLKDALSRILNRAPTQTAMTIDEQNIKNKKLEVELKQENNSPQGIELYRIIEREIIDWFSAHRNIIFNTQVRLNLNGKKFYPDGIEASKNFDTIIEVKMFSDSSQLKFMFPKVIRYYAEIENLYKKTNKNLRFYIAIACNKTIEDRDLDIIENIYLQYSQENDFNLFVFERVNDSLTLKSNY